MTGFRVCNIISPSSSSFRHIRVSYPDEHRVQFLPRTAMCGRAVGYDISYDENTEQMIERERRDGGLCPRCLELFDSAITIKEKSNAQGS